MRCAVVRGGLRRESGSRYSTQCAPNPPPEPLVPSHMLLAAAMRSAHESPCCPCLLCMPLAEVWRVHSCVRALLRVAAYSCARHGAAAVHWGMFGH